MNKSLHIEDPIEGETDDLGQQLHGVFEELRTEPEAFRRGVQQRIDTAGEEDTRGEDEYLSTARVPFLVRPAHCRGSLGGIF